MAVVQQYLFTSNRDYGILHIECNGKANLYMHHCFDDDDNLYVSTQDYQGSRNYTGYGGGKMTPTAILKINSKTGQVIWQKHVDMWKGGGSNRGIDIDTSGNLYSVHSTSSLIPYSVSQFSGGNGSQVILHKWNGSNGNNIWSRGYGIYNLNYAQTVNGYYVYQIDDLAWTLNCIGTSSVSIFGENRKPAPNIYSPSAACQNLNFVSISSSGSLNSEYEYTRSSAFWGGGYVSTWYDSVMDGSGNHYLVMTRNNSVGYYGLGTTNQRNSSLVVMKLNSSGVIQYQKQFSYINSLMDSGGTSHEGQRIAVDNSGNVYTGHRVRKTHSGAYYDHFIIKNNSSGAIQWVRRLGVSTPANTQNENIVGIVVDPDDNNYFYVLIQTKITLNGVWGSNKIAYVLVKYNSSGSMQWQRVIVGQGANGSGQMTVTNSMRSHGHRRRGSFYFKKRGIYISVQFYTGTSGFTGYHCGFIHFPVDTYLVGDWTIPMGSAQTSYKIYIRDMSTGIVSQTISSYAYWQNMDFTRYTNVGSAPGKTNYSPTSYSAQYMSNPVNGNSTTDSIVYAAPFNTFSAYTAGLHTE